MWKEKLAKIVEEKKSYDEEINSGANNEELQIFSLEVKNTFHFDLLKEYIEMLKVFNGLEFNGFILYGIDEKFIKTKINQHINGFIDNNQIWYENDYMKNYIFLGESNISWYVLDIKTKNFLELDNSSGSLIKKYKNFEELLNKFFTDALE